MSQTDPSAKRELSVIARKNLLELFRAMTVLGRLEHWGERNPQITIKACVHPDEGWEATIMLNWEDEEDV